MATQKFNLPVSNFKFPLLTSMQGDSVLIPTIDQEQEPVSPLWVENIIPTVNGVSTVAYNEQIDATGNTAITSVPEISYAAMKDANIYSLQTDEGTSTYYLVTPYYHFLYNTLTSVWDEVEDITTLLNPDDRTFVFFYKGRTILFNKNIGLWSYDFDTAIGYTKTVEITNAITLSSIVTATVAGSYIILAGPETIYWSSPLSGDNPGDTIEFDPTNPTLYGAGSSNILALKGIITVCISKPDGFFVYTTSNAIEATATYNSDNPWFFQEVKNSSGIFRTELVTDTNNAGIHFVWGDLGLASVQNGVATQQFPELISLFSGTIWEYWDAVNKLIQTEYNIRMSVKIAFLSGRYLCFSYGKENQNKEFILVLDTLLNRWGKLKISHLDIFDSTPPRSTLYSGYQAGNMLAIPANTLFDDPAFNYLDSTYEANYRASTFGILTSDYTIQTVDFAEQSSKGTGVLIYSGISLTRKRVSEILSTQISGIWDATIPEINVECYTPEMSLWNSGYLNVNDKLFLTSSVGKSHMLKIEGAFLISSIVLEVNSLGYY